MNISKNSNYHKFKNFYELLSEDSIVYVFASNKDEVFSQIDKIFKFCNQHNIIPKEVYYDISNDNNIINKPNLQMILRDKENTDLIVNSVKSVSNYCVDHWEVNTYLKESNIGVYNINQDEFFIERKPLLFWLS